MLGTEKTPSPTRHHYWISLTGSLSSLFISIAVIIALMAGSDEHDFYFLLAFGSIPLVLIGLNYAECAGRRKLKWLGIVSLFIHCVVAAPVTLITIIYLNVAIIIPWMILGFFIFRKRLKKRDTIANGVISLLLSQYVATMLVVGFISFFDWISGATSLG